MFTVTLGINDVLELDKIGAVRIFPAFPLVPVKNKPCLYKCGIVVNGQIHKDEFFYIWHKYDDALGLSIRLLRAHQYTKKYGFTYQYSGPEHKRLRDDYDPIMDSILYAGKFHKIDGPVPLAYSDEMAYYIAGRYYSSKDEFDKELKKYQPHSDFDLDTINKPKRV